MIQWMRPESSTSLVLFVYLLFHRGKKFGGEGVVES